MLNIEGLEAFILSEDDRKSFLELMEVGYIPKEPFCVSMNASPKEMLPFIGEIGIRGLGTGASFGIREKSSRKLIAVMSNFIVTPDNSDVFGVTTFQEEKSNKYAYVLRKFSEGVDVFNGKFKKCLELIILCVHPDYAGRGLAQELIKMSETKAREIGCELVTLQATNIITHHIAIKLGFEVIRIQDVDLLRDEDGNCPLDLDYMRSNGTITLSYLKKVL